MIKELRWVAGTLESIVERCGFQFPVNRSKLLDPPPPLEKAHIHNPSVGNMKYLTKIVVAKPTPAPTSVIVVRSLFAACL